MTYIRKVNMFPLFLKIPGFIVEKCLQCDYAFVKSKEMLVIRRSNVW